jgi:hypothetical protein
VAEIGERFSVEIAPGATTLEDVFIRLMSEAENAGRAQ